MSSDPVQGLLQRAEAVEVDADNICQFLDDNEYSVLFFSGNLAQFPESADLAIILPELRKAFGGIFSIALVASDADKPLASLYGITHWPSLVFHRGSDYLGCIKQLQNWAEYCQLISQLLEAPAQAKPGQELPVITTTSHSPLN